MVKQMRKLTLLLLLLIPSLVYAQKNLPISSGVVTANVEGNYNFRVLVTQNVTAINFTSANAIPGGTIINFIFTQDSTGHTVSGFSFPGGTVTSTCSVSAVASATTACSFQYDSTANTWFSIGGG